jgi:hypothetical protein
MINHLSSVSLDNSSGMQIRPDSAILGGETALQSPRAMNAFQEMVRARIRARVGNASTLARFLHEDPSTVTKRLKEGGPALCLDFLDQLRVFFGGWTPAEMVAEPESQIVPVTPIEASLLALFRQMTELERRSLLTVLERPAMGISPHAKKLRLGRAMLTVKEQELVDLFARVKRDGVREGVLKTLRGAAKDDEVTDQVKTRTSG